MSYEAVFTYSGGANPAVDYPRMLISDTQEFALDGTTVIYTFSDQEIAAATTLVTLQFQSAQFYSPTNGANLPSTPVPYLRIAAMLLDSMAANKAKLSSIKRILDVDLDPSMAAKFLREQAAAYREADDNAGAFSIIEQACNPWALRQRWENQLQRGLTG